MSTTETTYNGWTNYETWVTALWIDNDEGSYNAARDLADECLRDGLDKYQAADAFKDWAEGEYIDPIVEDGPAGLHVPSPTPAPSAAADPCASSRVGVRLTPPGTSATGPSPGRSAAGTDTRQPESMARGISPLWTP